MDQSVFDWEDQLENAFIGRKSEGKQVELEEGERRKVAVLFLDIQGFTTLSQHLDPEEARRIAETALQVFSGIVKQYGGRIDKLLGDGMMALFGSEHATENDLDQSILASILCIHRLHDVNERLRERSLTNLNIRIGINYGEVVVGKIAGERGSETVMGAVVNLASRMESNAPLNRILLPTDVLRMTRRQYETSEPRTIQVKGFDAPIEVVEVHGIKSAGGFEKPSGPFIGRNEELKRLRDWLSKPADKILLTGSAGIGKSRLVTELFSDAPIPVVVIRPPASVAIPFGYMSALIRRLLGLNEIRITFDEVAQALQPYETQSNGITDAIALLLGTRRPGSSLNKLTGEALFRELVAAIRSLFERLPQEPVCWVFEDGQWGDEVSFRMLADSSDVIAASIWWLLILRNKDELPFPPRIAESPTIDVDAMNDVEIDQLISSLLPGCKLPFRVAQLWHERANGLPLMVSEISRLLMSQGHLKKNEAGEWVLQGWVEEFTLPESLDGLFRSRFDQLDAAQKQWIELAAVDGVAFRYDVITRIGKVLNAGIPDWESLVHSGWIDKPQGGNGRFSTPLAQETAYSFLLKSNREKLHRLAAEAYESLYPEQYEEFSPVLARHWSLANEPEKAVKALAQWRRTATNRYDSSSALTAAMKMEAFLSEHDVPDKETLTIECKLDEAKLRRLLADYAKAEEKLEECIALFTDCIDKNLRARVYFELSYLRHDQSRLNEALEQVKTALSLSDAGNAIAVDCKLRMANFLQLLGRVNEGLEIAESIHCDLTEDADDSVVASVHLTLGFLYKLSGRYEEASRAFIESADASKRQGDRLNMSLALAGLADYYCIRKEFDLAVKTFLEAIGNFDKIGDKVRSIRAKNGLSGVYVMMKDFPAAEQILRTAAKQATELNNKMLLQGIHNTLGVFAGMQGKLTDADKEFCECVNICRSIGARQPQIGALSNLTQVAALRGCWRDVLKNAEELSEMSKLSGDRGNRFNADLFSAHALMMRNEAERALELLLSHIGENESPRYPILLSAVALAKTMAGTTDAELARKVAFDFRIAGNDDSWLMRYHANLIVGQTNADDKMPEEPLIRERAAIIRAKCHGGTTELNEAKTVFERAGAIGFVDACQSLLSN